MAQAKTHTKSVDPDAGTITFTFNGMEPVVVAFDDLSPAIQRRLALHGLSQKLGDSFASNEGVADARSKFDDVLSMLKGGEWSAGRSGTGGDLARALQESTGKPMDEVTATLRGMDDKTKRELRKHPQIAALLAKYKADKAAKAAEQATDTGMDLDAVFTAEG